MTMQLGAPETRNVRYGTFKRSITKMWILRILSNLIGSHNFIDDRYLIISCVYLCMCIYIYMRIYHIEPLGHSLNASLVDEGKNHQQKDVLKCYPIKQPRASIEKSGLDNLPMVLKWLFFKKSLVLWSDHAVGGPRNTKCSLWNVQKEHHKDVNLKNSLKSYRFP